MASRVLAGIRGIAVALALVLAGGAAAAPDLSERLKPYFEALEKGQTGDVTGRIYEEPSRPGAQPVGIGSVPLLLLPEVAGIGTDLEELRSSYRSSVQAYAQAADRLMDIRAIREQRMKAAGGEQLVKGGFTEADGSFSLKAVPAGDWIL